MGWPEDFWKVPDETPGWKTAWSWFVVLLPVLLAGVLIGLGGPFWYDTYRKLGALAGMAKGFQTTVQGSKEATGTLTDAEARDRIVEVFRTAIAAQPK